MAEEKADATPAEPEEALPSAQCPTHVYKGVMLFQNEIEQIETMDTYADDTFVCSYSRSGTTLTQEIVYLVMTMDFKKALTSQLDERFPIIDIKLEPFPYWRGICQVEEMPRPRFIKTHTPYFLLPEQLRSGKGKIIYILRNPKDVVVSMYKLLRWYGQIADDNQQSFEQFFEHFIGPQRDQTIYGGWCAHVSEFWPHRNDPNFLLLKYEEISTDRPTAIRKIANFLGKTITEDEVYKISEHCSVENMRKNPMINQDYQRKYRKVFDDVGGFINKGKVGEGKKYLTEEMIARLDDLVKRELEPLGVEFTT